jgi:hypothetical protein
MSSAFGASTSVCFSYSCRRVGSCSSLRTDIAVSSGQVQVQVRHPPPRPNESGTGRSLTKQDRVVHELYFCHQIKHTLDKNTPKQKQKQKQKQKNTKDQISQACKRQKAPEPGPRATRLSNLTHTARSIPASTLKAAACPHPESAATASRSSQSQSSQSHSHSHQRRSYPAQETSQVVLHLLRVAGPTAARCSAAAAPGFAPATAPGFAIAVATGFATEAGVVPEIGAAPAAAKATTLRTCSRSFGSPRHGRERGLVSQVWGVVVGVAGTGAGAGSAAGAGAGAGALGAGVESAVVGEQKREQGQGQGRGWGGWYSYMRGQDGGECQSGEGAYRAPGIPGLEQRQRQRQRQKRST